MIRKIKFLLSGRSTELILSQILRAAMMFVAAGISAKYLSKRDLIQFEHLLLLISSFSFFWVSGFTNFYLPSPLKDIEEQNGNYLVANGLFSLVFAIPLSLSIEDIQWELKWMVIGYFIFYTNSFGLDYFLFKNNQRKGLLLINSLYFIFSSLMLLVYFNAKIGIELFLFSSIVLNFIKWILVICLNYKRILIGWKSLQVFLKQSVPFLIGMLLGGAFTFLDSWVIRWIGTDSDFLFYRYGIKEIPILMMISSGISNTFSAHIVHQMEEGKFKEGLKDLKNESKKMIVISTIIVPILCLFAYPFYVLYYGSFFMQSSLVFILLLLINIPRMIFPQTILLSLKKGNLLAMITVIEILANIGFSLLLYPFFGIYGVVISTFLSFLIEKGLQIHYLHRIKIEFSDYTPVKELMISIFIILLFIVGTFALMQCWTL